MWRNARFGAVIFLSILAALFLWGCTGEQQQAELAIVDSEFFIEQDGETSYVVNAEGTIRNTGQVDVKNLEVTGYCRSCGEKVIDGQWFVSEYEKMDHQKDVIGYLAAGSEADFEFAEVALCMVQKSRQPPEELPEDLEISIASYEVAD
ncbi:MAG: hypothetical protein K9K62_08100 [Desulfobacteraceae bacterium]|nr:hypothetical protein [Desulfobacteraceae bacterium]